MYILIPKKPVKFLCLGCHGTKCTSTVLIAKTNRKEIKISRDRI